MNQSQKYFCFFKGFQTFYMLHDDMQSRGITFQVKIRRLAITLNIWAGIKHNIFTLLEFSPSLCFYVRVQKKGNP